MIFKETVLRFLKNTLKARKKSEKSPKIILGNCETYFYEKSKKANIAR